MRYVDSPRVGDLLKLGHKELPVIAVTKRGTVWVEDEGQERALFPQEIRAHNIKFIRKG